MWRWPVAAGGTPGVTGGVLATKLWQLPGNEPVENLGVRADSLHHPSAPGAS